LRGIRFFPKNLSCKNSSSLIRTGTFPRKNDFFIEPAIRLLSNLLSNRKKNSASFKKPIVCCKINSPIIHKLLAKKSYTQWAFLVFAGTSFMALRFGRSCKKFGEFGSYSILSSSNQANAKSGIFSFLECFWIN
jgi:hypothetical protein